MSLNYSSEFISIYNELDISRTHFFITGKAGTGKSTLLNYFRINTKKQVIVLAPTGLSALQVKGQTIHSFFKFKPGIINPQDIKEVKSKAIYRKIDTIIIDEVSMVRADVLDGIDIFLRKNGKNPNLAFGGIQLVFFGDLYQLPPVINNEEKEILKQRYHNTYFFGAYCFSKLELTARELTKIYRQQDNTFINILNHLREGYCNPDIIAPLKNRIMSIDTNFNGVRLVPTNNLADKINNTHLDILPGKVKSYPTYFEGDLKYVNSIDKTLNLKPKAKVIFTRNDIDGRWVNGTVAEVIECKTSQITVKILKNGFTHTVLVTPVQWHKIKYGYNYSTDSLEAHITGKLRQFPLRLAWAMTIHKSQGQTFDRVHLDMGSGMFAHGQLYVALSRCRSLEGTSLSRVITQKDLQVCKEIIAFHKAIKY